MNADERIEAALKRRPSDERTYDEPLAALVKGDAYVLRVRPVMRSRMRTGALPALAAVAIVLAVGAGGLAVGLLRGPSAGHPSGSGTANDYELTGRLSCFGQAPGAFTPGPDLFPSDFGCPLMAVPPAGYGAATWSLDPAYPYSAGATELHVLVEEWGCHSFETAEGRIAKNVEYGDDAVIVTLAVRDLSGVQTCPGTPPTPYAVHLDQPIGNRAVFDGGTWPAVARARHGLAIVTSRPYMVQALDSLASIAARLHFDPSEITAANPGIDPNHLTGGQEINIPESHWFPDCSGTSDHGNFFKVAGKSVKFALFCAAVPDGWTVKSSTLSQDSSLVRVVYAGPNGETFTLAEGAIDQADYPPTAATTALWIPEFGTMTGFLESVGGQHWCLVPEAPVYWVTIGQGMSLDEFTTLTRSLIRLAT